MPGFLLALEFCQSGEFSAYHPEETWLPVFESQHCAHSQLWILGQVTRPLCGSALPELFSKFKRNPHGILSWNYHEDQKKGARCSVVQYLSLMFSQRPLLLPSYVIISLFVVMATTLSGACGAGVHSVRKIPLI